MNKLNLTNVIKALLLMVAVSLFGATHVNAADNSTAQSSAETTQQALSLDQLLQQVKLGTVAERRELRAREARFLADKQQQAKLLAAAKKQLEQLQRRSTVLEKIYDTNAKAINERKTLLTER